MDPRRAPLFAQQPLPSRLRAPVKGSWDKHRPPSWRRSGPSAVVVEPRRGGISNVVAILALLSGAGAGALLARVLGLL